MIGYWGFLAQTVSDWMEGIAVRTGLTGLEAARVVNRVLGDGRGVKGVE